MIIIPRVNLAWALKIAIEERRKVEKEHNYPSDSGLVSSWVTTLEALMHREEVKVTPYVP